MGFNARQVYADIQADAAKAGETADAAPAVETPPVVDAAADGAAAPQNDGQPAADAAPQGEPKPASGRPVPPQHVALSKYNSRMRELSAAEKARADLTERLQAAEAKAAQLEARITQSLAAQNPAAAAKADATAQDAGDWVDQLIASGADVPPVLLEQLKSQQAKIDELTTNTAKLSEMLGLHTQVFESAAERAANATFDAKFAGLQARCPNMAQAELMELLADGIKMDRIIGWHDQMFGSAARSQPAPTAPAQPTGPKPTPVPQIAGTAGQTPPAAPVDMTREQYKEWGRQQLRGPTRH